MSDPDQMVAERSRVNELLAVKSSLQKDRSVHDSFVSILSDYIMPRKGFHVKGGFGNRYPSTYAYDDLFDTTAIQANMILANGMSSFMTPHDAQWFHLDAPRHLRNRYDVRSWYKQLTDIVWELFTVSNFATESHEAYLDLGGFGTSVTYMGEDPEGFLFRTYDAGTYSIAENSRGQVDVIFRDFELSARQAEQQFGLEALHEKVREMLYPPAGKGAKPNEKIRFCHCVAPREDADRIRGRIDALNKPFASVYIDLDNRKIVKEGGYDEFPYLVARYLKWGNYPYGWSPSWIALPIARQLSYLEENQDALAEKIAFPPILMPDNMEFDEPDIGAAGITYFDANRPEALPREWGNTNSDYRVGAERAEQKRAQIREAFHVPMFRIFDGLGQSNRMTTAEIDERSSERLTQFTPAFTRITNDWHKPAIARGVSIVLRNGWMPPPPPGVMGGPDGTSFPMPSILFSSRLALAIKQLPNIAWQRHLQNNVIPVMQLHPESTMVLNWDKIFRDLGENLGLPADWHFSPEEVQAMKEQMQQQQQAQAEAEQAATLAKAANQAGLTGQ